jgi:hypothetical protein
MIWLTWRQFRAQAITAAAALAVFAIVLATTASDLSGMYNSSGLLTCHGDACSGLASPFLSNLASGGGGFLIPGSAYAILYSSASWSSSSRPRSPASSGALR